jgi:pilus assembly protein Flp/PilA
LKLLSKARQPFSMSSETFCCDRNFPVEGTKVKRFLLDETGLELSEYAVAAALVAIAVVGAFTALGTAIGDKITNLGTTISK